MRRVIVLFLIASLASCAPVRPPFGLVFDSFYATEVDGFPFGIRRVRIHSILDGKGVVSRGHVYSRKYGRVTVSIIHGGVEREGFLDRFSSMVAEIPDYIDEVAGGGLGISRIDVVLVPEGVRRAVRSASWVSKDNIRLSFAIRAYPKEDETIHDGIRIMSHEIFHLAASLLGKGQPGYANERAALTVELCSEMKLTGYASRRFLRDPSEEWLGRNSADVKRTVSGALRYGEDRELDDIFNEGAVNEGSVFGTRLIDLCRSRVGDLLHSSS